MIDNRKERRRWEDAMRLTQQDKLIEDLERRLKEETLKNSKMEALLAESKAAKLEHEINADEANDKAKFWRYSFCMSGVAAIAIMAYTFKYFGG